MSDSPTVSTSEPIYKAAATIGAAVTSVLGLLGAAVSFGVLTGDQAEAIRTAGTELVSSTPQLAGALVLIVSIVSGLVGSFATAWQARKNTVPTDSEVYSVTATSRP